MSKPVPFLPFDFSDQSFKRNPYPAYAQLRQSTPILRSGSGAVFASSASAVAQISSDRRFGKAFRQLVEYRYGYGAVQRERAFDTMDRWVLHANPPRHATLRAPIASAFAARRIEALRPYVSALLRSIFQRLPKGTVVDLAAAVSFVIPAMVVCRLFGVPECDREKVLSWSGIHGRFLDPAPQSREFIDQANDIDASLTDYFAFLCRERVASPQDDLISSFVADRMNPEEDLVANIIFAFGAGHETTAYTISNLILSLGRFEDQRLRLIQRPELMKTAVDEILRYDPSVHSISRIALEDVSVDGFDFQKGDLVYCLTAAASRDPQIYANPEAFDVGREPGPLYSFGGGVHYCLGAQLARLELIETLAALLEYAPRFDIVDWDLEYRSNFTLRGVDKIKATL